METIDRIISLMDPDVRAWVLRHVRLEEDPGLPTAAATLDRHGYRIVWGAAARGWSDAELMGVLDHEIAHILRGDLLAGPIRENPCLWNVACDAVINESLRDLPPGVRWADLAADLGPLPHPVQGAFKLYEALKQRAEAGAAASFDVLSNDVPPGERGQAERHHAAAVLDAPRTLKERAAGAGAGLDVHPARPPAACGLGFPPLLPVVERIVRFLGQGQQRVRTRTFLREGRVEGLRGVARVPRARVVLALDCSGSMSEWVGAYWSLLAGLERRGLEVEAWAWADEAARWPRGAPQPAVGGGTRLGSLWERLGGRPDLVAVLTDGDLADTAEARRRAPQVPLVWLLPPGGRAPWPGDLALDLPEEERRR